MTGIWEDDWVFKENVLVATGSVESSKFYHLIEIHVGYIKYIHCIYIYIYYSYICIFIYTYVCMYRFSITIYNYTNTFISYFAVNCKLSQIALTSTKGIARESDVWGLDVPELPETCDDDCALSLRQLRGQQFEAKVGKHGEGRGGGLEPLFSPKTWSMMITRKETGMNYEVDKMQVWSADISATIDLLCSLENKTNQERNQAPTRNFLMI